MTATPVRDPATVAVERGIGRSSRRMAIGTLASRGTGFLRNSVIVAVLGLQTLTADAYNIANVTPNIIYELLLGGILTSVIVPLLVEATRRDEDGGIAYAQRLLTTIAVALGALTVVAVALAPFIVRLYLGGADPAKVALATTWARYFLPQIAFYGIGAAMGAVLNTRGRFAAPMWAPVLNNLVVIATAGAFLLVPGPAGPTPASITLAQITVLGVGTTVGIVVMTAALLPSLRATGFRWRLRVDPRGVGLGRIARLAGWMLVYVGVNQLGYFVVVRLASSVKGAYTSYLNAFTLWQLPFAVVAVSVITALLPRMSRHAVDGNLDAMQTDLGRGIKLVAVLLVPAALGFAILGRQIATLVYSFGVSDVASARQVGVILAIFAAGLVPFAIFQLQSRAFYALRDTRTPALVQCAVAAALITVDVTLSLLLPARDRVFGLAAGHATSYAVGLCISVLLLRRRLGSYGGDHLVRTLVRLLVAGAGGAGGALAVALPLEGLLGPGRLPALAVLVVAGLVGGAVYLALALRMRVEEIRAAARVVRARVGR